MPDTNQKLSIEVAASPAQIDAIRQLFVAYAQSRNFDAALGDFDSELAGLPGKYAQPKGCLLLATLDGQPAGCIAYRKIGEEICEIKRMYVSPPFRGNGISKKLIQILIQKARLARYRLVRLDSHPSMHTAQAIYRSFGFQPIQRYNDNPIPGILFFELEI